MYIPSKQKILVSSACQYTSREWAQWNRQVFKKIKEEIGDIALIYVAHLLSLAKHNV
jgi:hypothetical protein